MAAPSTYLTIVKAMPYRASTREEWSNSYALSGSTPADSTAWRALFDAIVAEEKKLYKAACKVVAGYGYNRIPTTGDHAIWSVDLTATAAEVAGTLSAVGSTTSGDQAAWVRWGLDRFNSRGKRVYLRKYFHYGSVDGTNTDLLHTNWTTALGLFGGKMIDGTLLSARKLVDKDGNVPLGHAESAYITTRTLKRRGKRPPT